MSARERLLALVRCSTLASAIATAAPAGAEPRTLSLEQALRLARENNASLIQLRGELEVGKARVDGASVWVKDNPIVTVTAGPRSSVVGKSWDYGVQLVQPLEIGGQRGARVDVAEASLLSNRAQLEATTAGVVARVREQFGRSQAMARRVELTNEALRVAKEGVVAAEERFRSGAAPILEVNTARVELGRVTREHVEVERGREQALAELGFLLGLDPADEIRPAEAPIGIDATPQEASQLVRQALATRAELKDARAAVDAAKAERRLAEREWLPTPRLGVSYNREQESRATIVQGIVAVDLPIFNRNQGARGVTAARARQAEAMLKSRERQVKQEVLTALGRLRAAEAAAASYQDDVVKAMQQNMDLVTESYRSGKIDFLQLMVIRRQAIEARREYIDVLENLNTARAELDLAVGRTQLGSSNP